VLHGPHPSYFLLSIARYSFLTVSLDILAALLAYVPVPLPIEPQLRIRSGERPNYTPHPSHGIEAQPRLPAGSYRTDARTRFHNLLRRSTTRRDTAAVVLNWSRFQNVRRIVSFLCGPKLEPIMKHFLVWNNNPKPATDLVRYVSPPCDHPFLLPMLLQEFYAEFLHRGKIKRS
jgi:hypothetical protein